MDARLRGGKDFRVDLFVFETEKELYDAAGGDVRRQQVGFPTSQKTAQTRTVCAFSATLFLQLALKLLKEHGPTPLLVQN